MITVESDEREIRVTIPKPDVDERVLANFLSWLGESGPTRRDTRTLPEIVAASRLTEAQADAMADEFKSRWWAANRHRFLPDDTSAP